MWKLLSLKAENIISFKEMEMNVRQNVATMIFGENHDSDKQKNNGSGKSSVIEAISFGLTGEPLRKVKTEEIINDSADMASVIVELENDTDMRRFTIERRIFRDKTPQQIVCKQYGADGSEVNKGNTVQPTVIDYNKFILEELGLSKDDLYNNYILCRNKYLSFFESSDKEKKEIINRFSNGARVDESISALDVDIYSAESELNAVRMEESKINGQIEAVSSQIEREEQRIGQFEGSKAERIVDLENKISEKETLCKDMRAKIRTANERLVVIRDLNERMGDLEDSEKSLVECYREIKGDFEKCSMPAVNNYETKSAEYAQKVSAQRSLIAGYENDIIQNETMLKSLNEKCHQLSSDVEELESENEKKTQDENRKIAEIKADIELTANLITDLRNEYDACMKSLVEWKNKLTHLEAMIRGAVTCPSCGHQFLLNNNISKEDVESEILKCQQNVGSFSDREAEIQSAIDDAVKTKKGRSAQIDGIAEQTACRVNKLREVKRELSDILSKTQSVKTLISTKRDQIKMCEDAINSYEAQMNGGIRRDMFDEVFDVIDATFAKGKAYVKQCEEAIESAKSSIEVFRKSIEDIKGSRPGDMIDMLESSRKTYMENLEKAKREVNDKMQAFNELQNQKNLFVEFKTHLANTKIDAISKITNKLLEDIGSDIRINLQGFKVLKTGKIREKITVQVLRNGVDCGSFEKMSAGERARICLANIIAMQALINANAKDDGRGLDFMAIDEIMDVSDEVGLMSYCETINKLGITVFMITQGLVSEGYPYRLVVTKENGISKISEQ